MTRSSRSQEIWAARLDLLRAEHLERSLRRFEGPAGSKGRFADRERLIFCSNDYLGLAGHPSLKRALCEAVETWGAGAGASRLVSGNMASHESAEQETAQLLAKEAAVLFVSGYQTNVGVLSTLVGAGDAIFSDESVHASLIDGARLSKAAVHIFPHKDTETLDRLLATHPVDGIQLVVTDSIFSMDGDRAPLADIAVIAERHNAAVYVDEAHAMGVLGPRGAGVCAELGILDKIDVIVGTYSKAYGLSGGFVATNAAAAALLRSKARGFLFSTGQPPALAAAIVHSLDLASASDDLREKLARNVQSFRNAATACGLPLSASETAIQPILTGANARTMAVSEYLWQEGFFVQGIRPPTVKPGQARLRITLSAAHEIDEIYALTDAVRRALDAVPS